METILPLFPTNPEPTLLFAFLAFLCSLLWLSKTIVKKNPFSKKKTPPEAGGAWPVIGHLRLLGGPEPPHRVLANMADKHGPIFTMKMGVHRVLVVSSWELVKECLTTNDIAFASRPRNLAMDILGYDCAMFGFSSYGPYWRQMRKLVTLELLSNHRLEKFKDVRESMVRAFARELYKLWQIKNNGITSEKVMVEMQRWFGDMTLNVIMKIIVGKTVGYTAGTNEEGTNKKGLKQELKKFFALTGTLMAADMLPFLRWLGVGRDMVKAMNQNAKELDLILDEWLKEHEEKKARGVIKGEEDFMGLLLNMLDDDAQRALGHDSTTINKATCLALISAASDTSTVTMTWALALLVNHPHVLTKVQLELDNNIGKERRVEESDMKNLVYLKAVIKETMRLYPAVPLSLPHYSTEDITIGDYHIPSGTQLFTNFWKVQRDPRVWPNPDEFLPERFLTTHKDVDVRGQCFELLPFGGGRRMCPGASFALQVMQLTLATVLHGFDFSIPSDEPIDMRENIGLSLLRVAPLNLHLRPRLPSHLYE